MPIVRLPGGALRDEIREPIYDTIDLPAGVVDQSVSRSFYSDVQGKDSTLTNLRQNNLLETAVSFRIQGLALDAQNFYAANAKVMPLVNEHSSLQLKVGEKVYWTGPMRFASGRQWTDLAGGAQVFQQHGMSAVAAVILTGKHVVDVNPLQSFNVDWKISGITAAEAAAAGTIAADTKIRYVCSLKGLKRRPVQ